MTSIRAGLILILLLEAVGASSPDPWILEANELPSDRRFYPTLANGYLGTPAYHESIHVTGVYNGHANATTYEDTSTHCRIPNPVAFRLEFPNGTAPTSTFQLNLYTGIFTEEIDIGDWRIQIQQYAHQIQKTLFVINVTAVAKIDNPATLTANIKKLTLNESSITDMNILEKRSDSSTELVRYRPKIQEINSVPSPNVVVVSTKLPTQIRFDQNGKSTWIFLMAALINQDDFTAYNDLGNGLGFSENGSLYQQHVDAWRNLWENGGRIDILGDNDLAQTVHSAQYYLLSSSPTNPYGQSNVYGWPNFGLSPASLAHSDNKGENYYGHIFWDQETWMLPALVPFQPDVIRRILVDSRIRRLLQAQQKAAAKGYDGAMFPWEAGYSGAETCNWEPGASREIHITGDIAQFTRQYLYWTNDLDFLINQGGYSLIYESAKFWYSRLSILRDQQNNFGVLDAMGPDEYHDHVNNSVYVNAIAGISMAMPDEFYKKISRQRNDLPQPDPNWAQKATMMYLPFDDRLGVHLEYDGYQNGTQVKQADVVLLGYPLLVNMSETVRRNDLVLYEQNTDPQGPCMTWAIHSINWLDLGDQTSAYRDFKRNFANIQGPFKIWTETAQGDGAVNFITGIGGFLQNILYGYLGLRPQADRLDFNPKIIPNTQGYAVSKVKYMGKSFTFQVTDQGVIKVVLEIDNRTNSCVLYDYSKGSQIPLGKSIDLNLGKYAIICS